ncbi:hypothetical protein GQ53DRAFT_835180 [Thozetella sp. PMI_491]|nr:hypothetical protein GQ53DRAFT_835180 [Thozetella sp. PMI_491]
MAPLSSLKGLLRFVEDCDNFPHIDISKTPYAEDAEPAFYQFLLPGDPTPHGFISPLVVAKMPWTPDFKISVPGELPRTVQLLDSSGGMDTSATCNDALARLIQAAIATKEFDMLNRPHSEDFKILGANPPVQMLRSAAPLFGIACRGAHMTVFVQSPEGLKIWVPRRSMTVKTFPGMLDSSVAGGIRAEESPFECILHEADEEASLDEDLVRTRVKSCGVITSVSKTGQGRGANLGLMVPECIYLYDLEVGPDVVLKPRDGEVKEFYLWDVETIKIAMENGEFKTNCAVVLIHFFIRHGIITPENERDYLELITRMHRPLPVPTSPST